MATKVAASLKRTGRLLLLGMGGSHAVSRAVEPLYRALGIDAIAMPLSEQLGQPLPLAGRTVLDHLAIRRKRRGCALVQRNTAALRIRSA